jgi:HSP20 family protein
MLMRNNLWKLLNDLNGIVDTGSSLKAPDDSNVESGHWIPPVDIREENDKFILQVDIPGVNPKKVEISMEDGNILTLKGSREETINEEKKGYHRIERIKGSFYRRFTLPDTADAEQVTATSRHGVLEVMIGKKKAVQTRKIQIDIKD